MRITLGDGHISNRKTKQQCTCCIGLSAVSASLAFLYRVTDTICNSQQKFYWHFDWITYCDPNSDINTDTNVYRDSVWHCKSKWNTFR